MVADLIDIAQQLVPNGNGSVPAQLPGFDSAPSLALAACGPYCGWYLRLTVRDRPGILACVASVLAQEEINIDSVLQEPHLPKQRLSFVITVEPVAECAINHAVACINECEFLQEPVLLVRVSEG